MAGCMYGWFYSLPAYVQTSDTWRYFNASITETNWLLKDPGAFIKDLFTCSYNSSGNLFIAHNSYWNNLKDNLIIKILAVINVLSLKNYYAAVIFFNFFFFLGCVAFYRLIKEKISADKFIIIAFVFCIPSFLFWCSGVHKDGFVFMAIALCVFYFNEWIKNKKFSIRALIIIISCCFLLFAFRNFVLLLLIPALTAWYLYIRFPKTKYLITAALYVIIVIAFFLSASINQNIDFPSYIINKQNEFKVLGGNSQLSLPVLQPTFISFIEFLPYAIDIAFLRPHITEVSNVLYWPSIIENIFIYTLVIYSIVKAYQLKRNVFNEQTKGFIIFCFAFAISNLLLMGYTITLTGAIVRYKAFVLPFIIAPLSAFVNINLRGKENKIIWSQV